METLGALIDGLDRDPDAPALIADRGATWSRGRLRDAARRFAAGLALSGVRSGDVVGLLGPNQPEWVAALLGIVRNGAIAMPLAETSDDRTLGHVLEDSGCTTLITSGRLPPATSAGSRVRDLVLLDDAPAPSGEGNRIRPWRALLHQDPGALPELDPAAPALLLYTSGTTGTPKGVPLSHANVCANLKGLGAARIATLGDRVLLPLPLHHAYPLTVGLLAPLVAGAAVVLPAGIAAPQILRALHDHRCTIMVGVPRLYEAMLDGILGRLAALPRPAAAAARRLLDLSIVVRRRFGRRIGRVAFAPLHRRLGPPLRLLASGGARLDPAVAWQLEGLGWEVLTGYGLTETAPILTFNPPGRARIGSVGCAVAGVELRLGPAEGAAPGQGEILARGPNVFSGYWKRPRGDLFTSDGFFRTGDLGRFDDGYLHIVGRSKELIVLSGGKNVFPEDVEAVYGKATNVREVAVLEHRDRLVALVVPAAEALHDASRDEVLRHLRTEVTRLSPQLPPYARVSDLAITTAPLPRTQIGKLRRHELAAIFERATGARRQTEPRAAPSAADLALLAAPPADRLWPWLQRRFEGRTLTLDTSPQLDLGLDSFDWMSLSVELEERFGVHLTEDAIARIASLRDLLQEAVQAAEAVPVGAGPTLQEARWLAPRSATERVCARLGQAIGGWLLRVVFRIRVEGLEHLPADGPYLMAPNHASYLDPPAIGAALPWARMRDLHWAGWVGIMFRGPVSRWLSRVFQVLPVDPEHGLTSTLVLGRAILEGGQPLVWFPEGQRSTDGRLQAFLPGVGYLLERSGVPAVPVWIEGTFEAWPPARRLPRPHPVTIRIGPPLTLADLDPGQDDPERHRGIATRLRVKVAALAPPGQEPL